jgi:hypothetical protein
VPLEAVQIVSDLAGKERPSHNRLCLEFVNETTFRGGEQKSVTFLVCRGSERKVINNADILVKIIGSNFRPQIFHSVTDQNVWRSWTWNCLISSEDVPRFLFALRTGTTRSN